MPISAGLALPDALHPAEELQEHVAGLTIHDVPVEEGDDEPEQPAKVPAKRAKGRPRQPAVLQRVRRSLRLGRVLGLVNRYSFVCRC